MEMLGIFTLDSLKTIVPAFIVVLLTYVYLASRRPRGFPPGPPVLPIVGSLPFWSTRADQYTNDILRMHKKYGDIFSVKTGKM